MDLGGILSGAGAAARGYGEARTANLNQAAALEQLRLARLQREQQQQEIADQARLTAGLQTTLEGIGALPQYNFGGSLNEFVRPPPPPPAPSPPSPPAPTPPPAAAAARTGATPSATAPALTTATPAAPAQTALQTDTPDRISSRQARERGIDLSRVEDGQLVPYEGAWYRVRNNSWLPGFGVEDFGLVRVSQQEERELNRMRPQSRTAPPAAAPAPAPAAAAAPAAPVVPAATPAPEPAPAPATASVAGISGSVNPATIARAQTPAPVVLTSLEQRNNLGADAARIQEAYDRLRQIANLYIETGNHQQAVAAIESMLGLELEYNMAVGLSGVADLRRGDPRLIQDFMRQQLGYDVIISHVVDNENRWTGNYQLTQEGVENIPSISANELGDFFRTMFDSEFSQQQQEIAANLAEQEYELGRQLLLLDREAFLDDVLAQAREDREIASAAREQNVSVNAIDTFDDPNFGTIVVVGNRFFRIVETTVPTGGGQPDQVTLEFEEIDNARIRTPRI